jgi:hypothetical protein
LHPDRDRCYYLSGTDCEGNDLSEKLGWIVPNGNTMPLDDWNAERRQYWSDVSARVMHPQLFPNGLLCPSCKTGYLYDTMRTVCVSPPIYQVKCLSCNFKGERYAE